MSTQLKLTGIDLDPADLRLDGKPLTIELADAIDLKDAGSASSSTTISIDQDPVRVTLSRGKGGPGGRGFLDLYKQIADDLTAQTLSRTSKTLDAAATPSALLERLQFFVPRAMREELVGDLLEDLANMDAAGRPRTEIWLAMLSQIVCALLKLLWPRWLRGG